MTVRTSGLRSVLAVAATGLVLGACVATPPPPYRNDPPYQGAPVRNPTVYQPPVYQQPPYRNDRPYGTPSANDDRVIYQNPDADRPIRNDGAYRPEPGRGDRDFTDPGTDGGRPDDRRPGGNPPRDGRPDRDGGGNDAGGDRGDDRRPGTPTRPDRDGNDAGGNRGDDRRPGDRNQGATRPQGGCNAAAVRRFVGEKATKAVLAEMRKAAGARTVRAAGPDMAVTMDFSPDRLTVELDRQDRVVRASCS